MYINPHEIKRPRLAGTDRRRFAGIVKEVLRQLSVVKQRGYNVQGDWGENSVVNCPPWYVS